MKHAFWHERWSENRIGFHQSDFNPWLTKYWSTLELSGEESIFVPLCGKSRDMLWLREQGHKVIGVELSDLACRDFFAEQGVDIDAIDEGAFHRRERDGISLLAGDVFKTTRAALNNPRAIYDRAALIALPPEMRIDYAAHIARLTVVGDQILLIALEYDNPRNEPPFSVKGDEVQRLFSAEFEIEELDSADLSEGRFENQREVVYRLVRR
jgi:thiopurine S-methyltransferase